MHMLTVKTMTYSVTHLIVAVTVAYALTRDLRVAFGIGLIEPLVQTIAYVLHEKAWSRGSPNRTTSRQAHLTPLH